jgi:hypothetical protein
MVGITGSEFTRTLSRELQASIPFQAIGPIIEHSELNPGLTHPLRTGLAMTNTDNRPIVLNSSDTV